MAKNFRRVLSAGMVLCALVGAIPLQALAAENTESTTTTTVENGLTTTVTTTTTTTTDENGTPTVVVEFTETTTNGTNSAGVTVDSKETTTTTTNADGSFKEVTEGSETTSTVVPSDDEIVVDVFVDGKVSDDLTGSSNTATGPVVSGDLKEENPYEYDQTTTTTTDRTADVTVNDVEVSSGTPVYVDKDGNIVGKTDDGFNYYWSDIYTTDGKSIIDGEVSSAYWTTGRVTGYIINADGTRTAIHREGVCQRVVAHDNGTPDDYSDDYEVGGLYCVDASTGIKQYLKYRRANLEDATYYSEDDIAHLRGIMTYGYTWDDDDNNGYTNLEAMKAMLKDAQANGDEATKAMLAGIDFDALTREQAATATGMAVWTYGNRYVLEEGQSVQYVTRNEKAENAKRIEAIYQYLCTLTEETPEETQIINEEKFVDSLEMSIGGQVEDHEANADDDDTNDVYNVELKFSLVVQPSATGDDLIVKVVDSEGNVVKTARVAGEQKEGESFGYAKTETDENGNIFYVLEDIELAENSNTSFNLKLEGTQLLKEGIYIFESQQLSREETIDQIIQQMEASGELEYALAELGSMEAVREYLAKQYPAEKHESQNFIGKYEGTAEIDVGMRIDLSFNVEEGTVTTERIWRSVRTSENEPPIEEEVPPTRYRVTIEGDGTEEIPEEPVPLAAAPKTGDNSAMWLILVLVTAFGIVAINISGKKRNAF